MNTKATPTGSVTIDVSILGREYKFACKPGEESELQEAVAFLDQRMREIRETGKSNSTERIAVMAALNLAHEYLRERNSPQPSAAPSNIDGAAAQRRIAGMRSAIDAVLSAQEKLL